MPTIDRAAGRATFGENVARYMAGRPDYPDRVYQLLAERCGVGLGTRAFEIGAGSGLATAHLLALGCKVDAIEPDRRFAEVLSALAEGPELTIHPTSFEESELPSGQFDLGIAATSFHWLEPDAALAKARTLLRPGAYWAMWWTVFGDPPREDAFHHATHHLFEGFENSPSHREGSDLPYALETDARIHQLADAGYADIRFEAIRWQPRFTTSQMVALVATYSPVTRLPAERRERFLADIGNVVERDFGGMVTRNFVTAIYTAVRP